jgi:hypothetical protein
VLLLIGPSSPANGLDRYDSNQPGEGDGQHNTGPAVRASKYVDRKPSADDP